MIFIFNGEQFGPSQTAGTPEGKDSQGYKVCQHKLKLILARKGEFPLPSSNSVTFQLATADIVRETLGHLSILYSR